MESAELDIWTGVDYVIHNDGVVVWANLAFDPQRSETGDVPFCVAIGTEPIMDPHFFWIKHDRMVFHRDHCSVTNSDCNDNEVLPHQ
jgi:hypothetical protein